MSADKIFVDTNILVYGYDISAGDKHRKASVTLKDLWDSGRGVLSTQVLQEFFVTVTRKLPMRMTTDDAKTIVSDLLKWDVAVIDGAAILEAIDLHKVYGYSFWDSLILVAAIKEGCAILLSEDLSSKRVVDGVTIKNPFE